MTLCPFLKDQCVRENCQMWTNIVPAVTRTVPGRPNIGSFRGMNSYEEIVKPAVYECGLIRRVASK
jgi:hypothetical protein